MKDQSTRLPDYTIYNIIFIVQAQQASQYHQPAIIIIISWICESVIDNNASSWYILHKQLAWSGDRVGWAGTIKYNYQDDIIR